MWHDPQVRYIIAEANPFKVLAVVDHDYDLLAAESYFENLDHKNVISFAVPLYER